MSPAPKKPAAKRAARACRWTVRKVKVRGKVRKKKVKVCPPPKAPKKKGVVPAPARPITVGQVAPLPAVVAPPTPPPPVSAPVAILEVPASRRHAERLLWRAGFGPAPGQAEALARRDLGDVVAELTRPAGPATLVGPEPRDDKGLPLAPADARGHDHLAWLDRMVRSSQPLVERMALIWHDWFATSNDGVGQQQLLLDQVQMFREKGLGTFDDLLTAVTRDPAMLVWLNGVASTKGNPNENYARELMELFTLGADRDAYEESDVREMARALTGFTADRVPAGGLTNFRYEPGRHDAGSKTIFGQTGTFDWTDAVRLCVTHPMHASFFCTKLWSCFVPTAPDEATLARLQGLYVSSGREIRPVVEAILQHPDLLEGPEMVVPPVVWTAGLLRAVGRGVDTTTWISLGRLAGQQLFYPPDVSGWDDTRWLDTCTLRGRWQLANTALKPRVETSTTAAPYDANEDAEGAVARALAFLGGPAISPETRRVITDFAASCVPPLASTSQRSAHRAMRQNALRMLIATSPDRQVS